MVLPARFLPRRADAVEVVGTALVARATGQGHRRIATELGWPVSTVHRWLRAVRGPHGRWLYRQGVEHTVRLAPELLADLPALPTELGDARPHASLSLPAVLDASTPGGDSGHCGRRSSWGRAVSGDTGEPAEGR